LADEVRLHLLENAREFFIPQSIHYEIHLSISNMLRRGYIDRNPVKLGMWIDQRSKINQLESRLQRRPFLRSKARGLCIVGIGGVGKSTAVENILSLYPQVITHTSYKGQDLILKQLVWVKLQCPSDGSLKSLCINYIEEVDDILGTNYIQRYGVRSRNADQLLLIMARIASIHFLGLIVFDEIQDLSEAKSGGATRMLNFFVQLENTLGIPFVLIGTPKAKALLSGEFRQARRISEQGDIYWRPMRETMEKENVNAPDVVDPDWSEFVRAMWRYWYLRKPYTLPDDLLNDEVIREIYKVSKGITALIVTVFFLAQRRAITSHVETLTKSVVKSAVKDNQYFVDLILSQINEAQQSKRSPRFTSDLDRSAWKLPEPNPINPKQPDKWQKPPFDSLNQELPASKKSESSNRKSRSDGKKKLDSSFEVGDLRALSAQSAQEKIDAQSFGDNPFGSFDEFH
jgi:hypothetical protein